MATTTHKLLDRATLTDGAAPALDEALDLADASALEIVLTVHQASEGDAPTLGIHHRPTQDQGTDLSFRDPVQISLLRAGRIWCSTDRHTRYVTWSLAGTLSGEAIVSVDIVARG